MNFHDANIFFKHKYPTADIEYAIERLNSFAEFEAYFTTDLMDENLLLCEYLAHLLDQYKMSANRASQLIGKSHSYVRKIINSKELNPSRDILLAICVLLGTTIEEAQILLRYSSTPAENETPSSGLP